MKGEGEEERGKGERSIKNKSQNRTDAARERKHVTGRM